MRFKTIALESLAIFASYLVFSLTLASATNVNIIFNGQVMNTANYEQESLLNMAVRMSHDPSDITWTNVKLAVGLNSASLANTITKIFVYKCRSATPTECVRSTPQVFDNYVDTELLWKDISDRTGAAQYPQVANLFFLVKLEDMNAKESWIGLFTETRRTAYNLFDTTQLSITDVNLYVKSLSLVDPAKAYIENKMMVPFKWADKTVFQNANPLYGIGASAQEADSHTFQTAVVSSSEITSINKDFYFVAPAISSGVASPVVLNLNPSFTCGNNLCESDIGETSTLCCYDCGCESGKYCDTASNINLSTCKADSSTLSVTSASTDPITDCARGFTANISARINNVPASASQVSGIVTLNKSVYTATCSGSSGSYMCSIPIASSGIKCGSGSYTIGPGVLNLTVNYKDGANTVSKSLSSSFSGVAVSYDCACQSGSYCDSAKKTCQSEAAITLGITSITSYLDNYHQGDKIYLSAKIFNPPSGLTLVDKSASMNITNGQVFPGTPDCSAPSSQYEYNCSIPFQISGYSNEQAYSFSPNTLYFTITYNDGQTAKTKTISAPFGPISIPSQACGDGQCNMGESQSTCCLDCGCSSTSQYCDEVNGCRDKGSVSISISPTSPLSFTDCREEHTASLLVTVNNAPSDMSLDYSAYLQSGAVKGWNLNCEKVTVSVYNCSLVIPALESEGCSLPSKTVSGNSLNMTVSFPDGKSKQVVTHLSGSFEDIQVTPVYHCGDGTCESDLGEGSSNCCYDCPCGESNYCDYDTENSFKGSCVAKASISLVIDSPTSTVYLSSCEITNSVNIKAHLVGQPTSAMPQYFYASLNGTSADMINCQQQSIAGNYTFNCTLLLPRIYKCTQGQTYTFSPNSLSVLLSYQNGNLKSEAITVTSNVPPIVIKQSIRTLYDITQDGIRKLKDKLQQTMQTAREMLDAFKDCMETVKTIGYITLIAAIAGGLASGLSSSTSTEMTGGVTKTISGSTQQSITRGVGTAVQIGQLGTSLMSAYGKMCEYLNTMYQMDLQIQQLEMKMIQMEMCMEMNQHMLDIGQCDKREESCFASMVSCVNFNDISSWTSQLTSIISSGNNALASMNTQLNNAANTFGTIAGTGYGTLQIGCDGKGMSDGEKCCGGKGLSGSGILQNTCSYIDLQISYTQNTAYCSGNYIVFMDGSKVTTTTIKGNSNYFNDKAHTFTIFCDANKNGLKDSNEGNIGGITVNLLKPNAPDAPSDKCTCTGSSGETGTGTVEAVMGGPSVSEISPGGSVSFTCKGTVSGGATLDSATFDCANGVDSLSIVYSADTEIAKSCTYSCSSSSGDSSLQYTPTCTASSSTSQIKNSVKQATVTCTTVVYQ